MPFPLALSFLGLLGVLSFLLTPLEALAPPGVGLSAMTIRGLAAIQPAVLVVVSVFVGNALAKQVSLDAPAIRAAARGDASTFAILGRQALPAGLAAIVSGLALAVYAGATRHYFPALAGALTEGLQDVTPPLVTRILYGGLSEEILCRWGLMTLIVWLIWRLSGARGEPAPWILWSAIAIAAVLFGAGHLPLLYNLVESPPQWLVALVVSGNLLPGAAFGWLYWRFGLEAAMLAHASIHLIGALVSALLS